MVTIQSKQQKNVYILYAQREKVAGFAEGLLSTVLSKKMVDTHCWVRDEILLSLITLSQPEQPCNPDPEASRLNLE